MAVHTRHWALGSSKSSLHALLASWPAQQRKHSSGAKKHHQATATAEAERGKGQIRPHQQHMLQQTQACCCDSSPIRAKALSPADPIAWIAVWINSLAGQLRSTASWAQWYPSYTQHASHNCCTMVRGGCWTKLLLHVGKTRDLWSAGRPVHHAGIMRSKVSESSSTPQQQQCQVSAVDSCTTTR
jgi:hypothetical protein